MSDAARPGNGKTLIDSVYSQLKAEVIHCRLAPGAKLHIEDLRARYTVSSSTMREALQLLVSDGLATSEGQRGFRVAPMSLEDISEITRLRKTIECIALRESILTGDDLWEAGIVAAFHQLSLVDSKKISDPGELIRLYADRNQAFHDALTAFCRSAWLQHFRRILFQAAERYRIVHSVTLRPMSALSDEHRALMEATLARDAELACRLTEEHLDRGLQATRANFDRLRDPPAD